MEKIKVGDKVKYSGSATFRGVVAIVKGSIATVLTKGQNVTVPTSLLTVLKKDE